MTSSFTRLALLLLASALPATARAEPAAFGDLRWRLLGPFRAGWSTMVEGVPAQPNTFYFGAAGGGVWQTRNAGRTWTSIFDGGEAASIGAIAIAPSNPQVIYVGTGQPEPRYDIASGRGVYRSTDGGRHWQALGLRETRYIGRIWVDPRNPEIVLVGAQGHFFGPSPDRGVYRSADGGVHWTQTRMPGPQTGVVDLASDPGDPSVIYAAAWEARQWPWQSYFTPVTGAGSAIYRSADGGVSWTRLAGGGWPSGPLGRISLAVTRKAGAVRVYAIADSKTDGGLWRSDDGGTHWVRANDEPAIASYYASRVTVAPDDPDVVFTVGQSIRRCDQGGARCAIVKGAPGGDDYHHVWINPLHPDHVAAASDQGTTISVDGMQSWSDWYNQPTGQFYHLAADNRFPYWVYSGQQDSGTVGIASCSDFGAIGYRDWHPVGGDERDYDIPDPADPDIVYGSGLGGRVSRFDARTGQVQNIAPWPVSSYGKRPTTVRYRYNWVSPLAASRAGPPALYLGAQSLFRTLDGGRNWATISPDLTGKTDGAARCDGDVAIADARACGYGNIVAIEPSPRHADEIWVGTDDGLIQLTEDGGGHWRNVTPPAVAAWAKVQTVDLGPVDGVAYAAIDGQRLDDFAPHVLRTRDHGASWSDISAGLPAGHIVSVVRADPVRPGLLYAGTDAGVFVSLDDGAGWRPLQQNLPTAWVRDLLVHGDDLIAATQGRAIWLLDDVTALRQMAATGAPTTRLFAPAAAVRVRASNNVDTPVPPETPLGENPPEGAIIDYALAGDAPVTLEIRDAAGALVRRFSSTAEAPQPPVERYFDAAWLQPAPALATGAGLHRFVWDLRYERSKAAEYGYSIAAVWGRGVPVVPRGPLAPPGDYRVVLTTGKARFEQPLTVRADPRATTGVEAMRASFDLSRTIEPLLARARRGAAEMAFVRAALGADSAPARASGSAAAGAALGALRTGLDQPATLAEPGFTEISGTLAEIETDLESSDAAPTAAQRAVVEEARQALGRASARWDATKRVELERLNAARRQAHRAAIIIPANRDLPLAAPEGGQDLP